MNGNTLAVALDPSVRVQMAYRNFVEAVADELCRLGVDPTLATGQLTDAYDCGPVSFTVTVDIREAAQS